MAKKSLSAEEVEEFRRKVCEAAARLIVERGVYDVTMRQIAAAVGVGPMTTYRYFSGKDDILAAVQLAAFDAFATALETAARSSNDPRARAAAVGEAYVKFAKGSPAFYRLMFDIAQPQPPSNPKIRAARDRRNATMRDYVQSMIDAGLLRGDAQEIGAMFWATMHGLVMLELADKLPENLDPAILRRQTMRALFIGLSVSPPAEEIKTRR